MIPERFMDRVREAEARHQQEPIIYLMLNEHQTGEIAAGRVPGEVQEMARTMIDWTFEDLRQNAARTRA